MWFPMITFLAANTVQPEVLVEPDPLCGANCLYVALGSLDVLLPPFSEFRSQLGEPDDAGYSFGEIAQAAESYGVHSLGVQTNTQNLQRRPGRYACIAYLSKGHFVLLTDVRENVLTVIDPPRVSNVDTAILQTQWDGTALLLSSEPLLAEEDLPTSKLFRSWWVIVPVLLALACGTVWLTRRSTTNRVASSARSRSQAFATERSS